MVNAIVLMTAIIAAHAGTSPHAPRCGREQYPLGSGYPLRNATFSDPSNEVISVSKVVRHDQGRDPYVLGYYYKLRNGQTFYEATPSQQGWVRNDQRDFLHQTGIAARQGPENVEKMLSSPLPFSMPAKLDAPHLANAKAQIESCPHSSSGGAR